MAPKDREKQPLDVSGGVREHRTIRRSGPATGASMAGRREFPGSIYSIACSRGIPAYPPARCKGDEWGRDDISAEKNVELFLSKNDEHYAVRGVHLLIIY